MKLYIVDKENSKNEMVNRHRAGLGHEGMGGVRRISVIIPAYNESTVISRCINALKEGFHPDELEIIVACNGCTDDTAERARSLGKNIKVLETPIGNKIHALNLAEKIATCWPRFYVDADVVLKGNDLRQLAARLEKGDIHAVAPLPTYDVSGSSFVVRAYFDIHQRLPMYREGIGGSGVYGMSRNGRSRFSEFPMVTADDIFVRLQFLSAERETDIECVATVTIPVKIRDLIAVSYRSYYGVMELKAKYSTLWRNLGPSNHNELLRLTLLPWLWHKLLIYIFVKILCRMKAVTIKLKKRGTTWERDESSRRSTRTQQIEHLPHLNSPRVK